jgi:hypothetical protein
MYKLGMRRLKTIPAMIFLLAIALLIAGCDKTIHEAQTRIPIPAAATP